jgi:hypothetical protein
MAGGPVMSGGPDKWDLNGLEAGSVIRDREGYRLYYTGFDSSRKCSIGLATSKDLLRWTKHPASPIFSSEEKWEERGVAFPAVLRGLEERMGMVYGAYGPGPAYWGAMQLGTATSDDGLKWKRVNPYPTFRACSVECWDAGVEIHQVISVGDQYVMLYEGLGLPGRYNLGIAFSPDCVAWARHPSNPIFPLAEFAAAQHIGTVHPWLVPALGLLYYTQVDGSSPDRHQILAARFDLSIIDPLSAPSLIYELCDRLPLPAGEWTSSAIPSSGRSQVEALVYCSSHGRAAFEFDTGGTDDWLPGPSVDLVPNRMVALGPVGILSRRCRIVVHANEGATLTSGLRVSSSS